MTSGDSGASDHKKFATAHPEIPWAQMRGMRNRMAHRYFDIDLNIVWQTVQSLLPALEGYIAATLASMKERDALQSDRPSGWLF